jgi:sugar/nucleoside kinase (ribokinase family)
LAAPEVPLEARAELLELATRHRFFRTGSFTSEEIHTALGSGLFGKLDLLVINRDEAATFVDVSENESPGRVAAAAVEALRRLHPALWVVVTAGNRGSWAWDGTRATHCRAYEVDAVSAAGSGDAFWAGVLTGLAAELPLAEAQQLGALTGALSVTSPHTIHPGLDRESLAAFAKYGRGCLAESVCRLLGLSPSGERRSARRRPSCRKPALKEGGRHE